jgi:hypothetical protein
MRMGRFLPLIFLDLSFPTSSSAQQSPTIHPPAQTALGDRQAIAIQQHSFTTMGGATISSIYSGQVWSVDIPFFSCPSSPHVSVANSWVPVPKDAVPQGFHVHAHGDFYNHRQDIRRQGVE